MLETDVIILRTVNYQENSLILHCLSPEVGRINILARGAKKVGKKQFPHIGLFRVISIIAKPPLSGDLYYLQSSELVNVNDHLACAVSLLDFSASLSQFSLSSSFHGIPCPIYYHHLLECISKVDKKDIPQSAWICRLLVSFMMEQGLFPNMQLSEDQKHTISILIDENCAQMESLNFSGKQWSNLHKWSLKTALYAGIDLPQAPHFQAC